MSSEEVEDDSDLVLEAMGVDENSKGKSERDDDDEESAARSKKKQCVDSDAPPPPPPPPSPERLEMDNNPKPPAVPRIWNLTPAQAAVCNFAWFDWIKWFNAFRNVKASLDPVVQAENQKELTELTDELYHIWHYGCSRVSIEREPVVRPPGSTIRSISIAFAMFYNEHAETELNQDHLDRKFDMHSKPLVELFDLHRRHGYCDSSVAAHNKSMTKANKVLMALQNAHRMLTHGCALERLLNPDVNNVISSKHALFNVENFTAYRRDMDNAKDNIKLILYLIAVAAQKGYRRYRGSIYKEKFTAEGYRTYFWERVSTIEDFIYLECDRVNNRELSMVSWDRGIKQAVEVLTNFHDMEFPTISVDRHVFSFRNGIYFAATRHFAPYDKGQVNWNAHAYVRNSRTAAVPKVTNASANYFDVDFFEYDLWDDIPTPTVDKVLNDQDIPKDAQKAMWGLLGRLLYEVGELDDWQILLWFLGRANSGKSTMCKIITTFYREEDLAVLSNEIEEVFGLEAIYNKFCFVAFEIKKNFKLPQSLFQSMVSGEGVSVSRKNRVAESVRWTPPGVVAGNEVPRYVDSAGSFVRRLAMIYFNKSIKKVDGEIANRFKLEVAGMLLKANQAYHLMLEEYGTKGVWEKLPPYFKETQSKLKCKTHPMHHYLQSAELDFDPDLYMTLDSFRAAYVTYVTKCNLTRMQWSDELYESPFEDHGLTVEKVEEIEWPMGTGNTVRNVIIVRGAALRAGQPLQNPLANPHPNGGPSPMAQEAAAPSQKKVVFRKNPVVLAKLV